MEREDLAFNQILEVGNPGMVKVSEGTEKGDQHNS